MFAFLVFWGYISFSEFFLIWYAAIPEETVVLTTCAGTRRRGGSISITIVCVKFIIPFFLVMSRNAKRNFGLIGLGAAWIVTLHLVEMYYWVMPFYSRGEFAVLGHRFDDRPRLHLRLRRHLSGGGVPPHAESPGDPAARPAAGARDRLRECVSGGRLGHGR